MVVKRSRLLSAYRAATGFAEPLAARILRNRLARGKEDEDRLPERLGRPGRVRPKGPLVWIHAASVGESVSVLPLIRELGRVRPDTNVLVTTGTVTSGRVMGERLPAKIKMKKLTTIICFLLALLPLVIFAVDRKDWTMNKISRESVIALHRWAPTTYLSLSADISELRRKLQTAPDFDKAGAVPVDIELPMPDGGFETFRIFEIPGMHPELQNKFPGIRTFGGNSKDHPLWSVRCDYTQFGFHANINSEKGVVYIDLVSQNNTEDYIIYYKHFSGLKPKMACELAENSM